MVIESSRRLRIVELALVFLFALLDHGLRSAEYVPSVGPLLADQAIDTEALPGGDRVHLGAFRFERRSRCPAEEDVDGLTMLRLALLFECTHKFVAGLVQAIEVDLRQIHRRQLALTIQADLSRDVLPQDRAPLAPVVVGRARGPYDPACEDRLGCATSDELRRGRAGVGSGRRQSASSSSISTCTSEATEAQWILLSAGRKAHIRAEAIEVILSEIGVTSYLFLLVPHLVYLLLQLVRL